MSFTRRVCQWVIVRAIVCVRALISPVVFGVVGLVRNGEGRVLLVRARLGGGWALPGGGVGRGEPPERAVLRELREEVGLTASGPPQFLGLYTRRVAWATNLIAAYDVPEAQIAFRPNFEICEICWADPEAPPVNTQIGTARRLAEFSGQLPRQQYW